ncbi:MAG: hypothetical protein HY704_05815 [Gemmatimonadetes bacterium]|nr:hypothetical protein [Gemmatimonadota bacterium]
MSPRKPQARGAEDRRPSLRFSAINLALVLAGLVSITIGYLLLAQGSVAAAPLLLVLGYVVLLPLGIIL